MGGSLEASHCFEVLLIVHHGSVGVDMLAMFAEGNNGCCMGGDGAREILFCDSCPCNDKVRQANMHHTS